MNIGIAIPAYQPDDTLLTLVESLKQCLALNSISATLIVVDDGSDSQSAKSVFQSLNKQEIVILLTHAENLGKGAALKSAITYAHNNKFDVLVTADADGQHCPDDIVRVAKHCIEVKEFVIGVRSFEGNIPARSHFGNVITSFLFRLAFKQDISDTQSGLRAIPAHLYPLLLSIKQNRYEFEFRSLIVLSKAAPIHQLPIRTIYEPGNPTSHFRPLIDSALIYFVFVRYVFFVLVIAALDIGAFFALKNVIDPLSAFMLVRAHSAIIYFIVMRKVVFRAEDELWSHSIKFVLLVLANMVLVGNAFFSLGNYLAIESGVTYLATTIVMFGFNFWVQRYVIFKK